MKKYKVIDSFPFNGELEMLKMRLDYYNDSVDYFVICESDFTQIGEKKDLVYLKNSELFKEYQSKIIYIVFTPTEDDIIKRSEDRFYIEKKHRDFMRNTIVKISDENTMTILSDVDEFPKKEFFDELRERTKNLNMDAVSCKLKTFYYSPLCELNIDCFANVAINHYTLVNISNYSDLRGYTFNCPHLENAGWHLSYFHTPEIIQKKIIGFSHQEYNNPENVSLDNIRKKMYSYEDVLSREEITITKHSKISDEFPIEFYKHDIFLRNTFQRLTLKPWVKKRKDLALQIPLEIENLQLEVQKIKPKVIVEIGSAGGGTLTRWLEIPSVETIISIDLPHGIHGGVGFEERTYVISDMIEQANLTNKKFYAINGNSKDSYIIDRLTNLLDGQKIDFLFIDGDHRYEGVKNDFVYYEKFLKKGSLVGFHDIIDSLYHRQLDCFVSKFWTELKSKYKFREFIHTTKIDSNQSYFGETIPLGGFGGIGIISYDESNNNISLVVPVYNNAEKSIEYISTTTRFSSNINEVIIYSNGTTSEENELLKNFEKNNSNVKLFIVEKPIGFVKAVNESFKKCSNELILCMNSDAVMYDDWESRLLPLTVGKNIGLIGPVKQDNFILGCCFIVKKSILNKIGLLNEGFGLGYCDDGELTHRFLNNDYDINYYCELLGYENKRLINFPLNHAQGMSFRQLDEEVKNNVLRHNIKKFDDYLASNKIYVLKNLSYEEIKKILKDDVIYLIVNYSGENFEKIRYDEEIVRIAHIFECTNEMNIDDIITAFTKGKEVEFLTNTEKKGITWLAKFDDYSSMGILSQRILENIKDYDISCKSIIGESTTKSFLIRKLFEKQKNSDLGIMFSYPDQYPQLRDYKTKVIYTGVDTTGGIINFAENCNQVDFLLTPSNKSKKMMEALGVKKPIYVFPHGVDKNLFKFRDRVQVDKFKFLYVGECSDRKGIFQLLNAFIALFKNSNEVELHLKSNNDMLFYGADQIKKIISENSNIFWHHDDKGHSEIIDLYNECHAYVYPSRADTFGMTLIEAMACGLPIISTNEPGATELIEGRYFEVESKMVDVKNHPWMLGQWGEPLVESLKEKMNIVYTQYNDIVSSNILKENSEYVLENYNWEKLTSSFENDILPKFHKKYKVLTLLTSFNRPHHIENIIDSLKKVREKNVINDVYIVENSNPEIKTSIIEILEKNVDSNFKMYNSEFNLGQRGALLQMLEEVNIDNYDFVQFTDQDNLFNEPLSTYCDILIENPDIHIVTGYMSKEHGELGWRETRHGFLCEKRSCRAGHMFMRTSDLKSLFPIHLDGQYGEPHNSSWNAGLDWELQYWNKRAFGRRTDKNFVLCLPGGVLHKGTDSTMYDWPVEENEYKIEELTQMRFKTFVEG